MQYLGEIISLVVAVSWTATALLAAEATKRLGTLPTNVYRMVFAILFIGATLWVATGSPLPQYADGRTWFWLCMSGLVGYVFGDYCLFSSYLYIGSRYGQLFMTLAPPTSAVLGWMFLHESLGWLSILAMAVTLAGIAMSVLSRKDDGTVGTKLPLKGILFGIGAGVGQGSGLILSKIGMDCYSASMPSDVSQAVVTLMPFTSTMIRAVAGLVGFFALLVLAGELPRLREALHNRRGMSFTLMTTFFGPFIGVSLSLMAVQYTKAGIASTIMALTPALIILPYSLIYHQKVSLRDVLGTIISLVGVAMFFL